MATLNLTSTEFADIAMIYLLDQVMNPEQVSEGRFKTFLEKHSSKIKTPLIKYYLDTRGEPRVMYKRIKGVFDGSDKSIQQIRIGPDEEIKKLDKAKKGIVSKLIKKIIAKEQLTIEDEQMLKEIEEYEW